MTLRDDDQFVFRADPLEPRRLLAATVVTAPSGAVIAPANDIGGIGLDGAFATATDSAGNSIVAGVFSGTVDFQPGGSAVTRLTSVGQSDVFVAKYAQADGHLIWVKQFGGGAGKLDNRAVTSSQQTVGEVINRIGPQFSGAGEYVNSLKVGPHDTIFFCGSFKGTADFDPTARGYHLRAGGYENAYVVKLRSTGSMVWAKNFGGPFDDVAKDIVVNASGNVYVTGYFTRTADFDPTSKGVVSMDSLGRDDAFVMSLNGSGNLRWVKKFGGDEIATDQRDQGLSIALDAADNVYATGEFSSKADFEPGPGEFILKADRKSDIFIVKLHGNNGKLIWAQREGGGGFDGGANVAIGLGGALYVSGYFSDTADLDPDPNHTVELDARRINHDFDGVDTNIFVQRLSTSGKLVWVRQFQGDAFSWIGRMVSDDNANVELTGGFAGELDFDPSKSTHFAVSTKGAESFPENSGRRYSYNVFDLKLTSAGAFDTVQTFGSTSDDWGIGLTTQPDNSISNQSLTTVGRFKGTVDFLPGPGTRKLKSRLDDAFVLYLTEDGLR